MEHDVFVNLIDEYYDNNLNGVTKELIFRPILNQAIIKKYQIIIDLLYEKGFLLENTALYDSLECTSVYLMILYDNFIAFELLINDLKSENKQSFIHPDILLDIIKLAIELHRNIYAEALLEFIPIELYNELLYFSKDQLNYEFQHMLEQILDESMLDMVKIKTPNFVIEKIRTIEEEMKKKFEGYDDMLNYFFKGLVIKDGKLVGDFKDLSVMLEEIDEYNVIGCMIYILTKLLFKDQELVIGIFKDNLQQKMEID